MSIEPTAGSTFDSADWGTRGTVENGASRAAATAKRGRWIAFGAVLFLLHAFCMLYRYGQRPPAPVIGDEVTINDPAIALSRGLGLVAPSFKDSIFGFDKLYAHFPPVYIYVQSLAFRLYGISVYSLRFTTTVADICAMGAFLLFLYWLLRRRLAGAGTAALAAMLYTLNASVVALHRIARMEPLVEFLAIVALWCMVAGVRSVHRNINGQFVLLSALACVIAGVAIATHPEAFTAVLPMLVVLWLQPRTGWRRKWLGIGLFVSTPVAIWAAAYRSRSIEALKEMWRVGRFTPGPGMYSFAHAFTREDHRNIGQGMRASLFVLCVTLFLVVIVRWWVLERAPQTTEQESEPDAIRLMLARAFALSTGISIVLLIWFVGASISRYEVMYPIWLLGVVLVLRGNAFGRAVRIRTWLATAVVLGEIVAVGVYLWRPEASPVDSDSHRFDAIVAQIPPGETIAATPMLWLAFEQQNRPFTLLYWRYDGREKWKRENGGNPLKQFDAVVIDESFIDDYMDDTPYAAEGRTEKRYVVGSDVVHLFLPRGASE